MNRRIQWPIEFAGAATLLTKAADFAGELKLPLWDFAVEIDDLLARGLSRADLRWLECHGLVEHLAEFSQGCCQHRQFRSNGRLTYDRNTCFVLTPLGLQAAWSLVSRHLAETGDEILPSSSPTTFSNQEDSTFVYSEALPKPLWNSQLFRLSLRQLVVKEYRRPALNQQRILTAFQEEDWPARIDDPLPPLAGLEPKRRLRETITALNRHQANPVLRFSGDGTGHGVKWMLV